MVRLLLMFVCLMVGVTQAKAENLVLSNPVFQITDTASKVKYSLPQFLNESIVYLRTNADNTSDVVLYDLKSGGTRVLDTKVDAKSLVSFDGLNAAWIKGGKSICAINDNLYPICFAREKTVSYLVGRGGGVGVGALAWKEDGNLCNLLETGAITCAASQQIPVAVMDKDKPSYAAITLNAGAGATLEVVGYPSAGKYTLDNCSPVYLKFAYNRTQFVMACLRNDPASAGFVDLVLADIAGGTPVIKGEIIRAKLAAPNLSTFRIYSDSNYVVYEDPFAGTFAYDIATKVTTKINGPSTPLGQPTFLDYPSFKWSVTGSGSEVVFVRNGQVMYQDLGVNPTRQAGVRIQDIYRKINNTSSNTTPIS